MQRRTIVVAHYNEDLSWLTEVKDIPGTRIFVYSKAPADKLPVLPALTASPNIHFQRLPNVGREAHTYLHHIITHYDSIASGIASEDLTNEDLLFTQGNPFDHRSRAEFFDNYVKNNNNTRTYPPSDRCAIHRCWKPYLKNVKDSGGGIGGWWAKVFPPEEPFPRTLKIIWFAIFRVKSEHILRRPLAFYERAIKTVNHHIDPEEGHFFERAWGNLFFMF